MSNLREEIARQVKLFHIHPNLELSYIDEAKLILKMIEKRIDSIERFPARNSNQIIWNRAVDDTLRQIKELLK